uniref:Uncharacterized protein n=1 Tax=Rhipicephalus zambeziensis TaxID=60191 RepID=A0A224Y7K5_9ACAR
MFTLHDLGDVEWSVHLFLNVNLFYTAPNLVFRNKKWMFFPLVTCSKSNILLLQKLLQILFWLLHPCFKHLLSIYLQVPFMKFASSKCETLNTKWVSHCLFDINVLMQGLP